ncbi:MAG: segregation and condensation protein A [Gammaproteobacteria bacterium]|nr:segregation and condensation protein A [Gammaproteobacteria bacterium]
MSQSEKERKILMVMRQVLGSIIREITPEPGMRHPLSEKTIGDVRACLGLITARERELADAAGAVGVERPYFSDQEPSAKVVPMRNIGRRGKNEPDKA